MPPVAENLLKRGGTAHKELADQPPALDEDPTEVLALDEAMERLDGRDPLKAKSIEFRFLAGLSIDAAALNLSRRAVDNQLRFARAWLHRQLAEDGIGA